MRVPNAGGDGIEKGPVPMPSGGAQDIPQGFGGDETPDLPDTPEMDDNGDGKSDSEIDSIFSKLDTEKQAAVIKYAKSMVGGDDADGEPDSEGIVNEIANNILDGKREKPEKDEDRRIRNRKVTVSNPFVSKDFNK